MARRTFARYKAEVVHALGNPDTTSLPIAAADIVNDAVEHISAMHTWSWLSTGQISLNITGGQSYVLLPTDFDTPIALEHTNGFARQMIPTTWQDLLQRRQQAIQDWAWSYWYVINTGNVTAGSEDAGLAASRLELYPTPQDTLANAIQIVYRRKLRRMVADNDVPEWPSYMDRLCSLLARAFATTDYDDNPEAAYTAEFSALLTTCIETDGLAQGSLGTPRGGLWPRTVPVSPFYPQNIPNPINEG